jgi:glyoxylase-like metal-dependent hydrolase (beta-lactamase superfamily II)
VPEEELRFYTDTAARDALPEARRGAFLLTSRILAADGDNVKGFPHGHVLPGVQTLRLPGHTPGQNGFLLQDGEKSMLFWGDALHMEAEQARDPKIGMIFDIDRHQGAVTRRRTLEVAAARADQSNSVRASL